MVYSNYHTYVKKKVVSYPIKKRNECLCNVDISSSRSCFEFDGKPVIAEAGHVAEMTQGLVRVLPQYKHVILNLINTSGTKAAYKLAWLAHLKPHLP